ncbi:MAG: 7-cyano-7-deazaguanine synthase QueC [Verrucomicrobia bacterium]|nr:MAG: 7-cyano-7-deazaguanine synthase QueC [Verrucomicrobiota bacterium]
MKRAVVLLSGGLDSATTLAIAKQEGYDLFALSFRYGQRHQIEVQSAQAVAKSLGIREHRVVEIDLRAFGGSALTDAIDVPKNRAQSEIAGRIPVTYVPARNTIFLSYALAWAEVIQARDIFIGVNSLDYSGYPDCRPEFIVQFEKLAQLATRAGVEGTRYRVQAPLIAMTKAQIIGKGAELGVQFALTTSCYDPAADGSACGQCDSCLLRAKGFREARIPDPTQYREWSSRSRNRDALR